MKLGDLVTQLEYDLEIKQCGFSGKLRANLQHPQIAIRFATWSAIIGIILGILGLSLGLLSVWLVYNPPANTQQSALQTNSVNSLNNTELNK